MTMFLSLAVLLAMVVGAVLTARRFRIDDDSAGGSVGGVIAPCVLALYLAAAAMGVVIGWENFTGAGDGINQEVGAAESLYWSTAAFPDQEAEEVREDLRAYMVAVAEKDWPMMRDQGELSTEGEEALAGLAASVRSLSVSDTGDGLDRLTARQELAELSDARVERADAAGDGIPPVLNAVAALSAIAVAVLPFAMIRRGSAVAYFWASASLVFVFATILLLFHLGNPFNGALAHDAGAVEEVLARFELTDSAINPG